MVTVRFIFDPKIGIFSRAKRQPKGGVPPVGVVGDPKKMKTQEGRDKVEKAGSRVEAEVRKRSVATATPTGVDEEGGFRDAGGVYDE